MITSGGLGMLISWGDWLSLGLLTDCIFSLVLMEDSSEESTPRYIFSGLLNCSVISKGPNMR